MIDGPLYNKYFDVAPSQFGYQKWGGTLTGILILPANETYHRECPKCVNPGDSMCNQNGTEPLGIFIVLSPWMLAICIY